jgi:hypothetical protein
VERGDLVVLNLLHASDVLGIVLGFAGRRHEGEAVYEVLWSDSWGRSTEAETHLRVIQCESSAPNLGGR